MVDIQLRFPRQEGGQSPPPTDDYSQFSPYQTPQPQEAAPTDYSGFTPYTGPEENQPAPQVRGSEAAGLGVGEGLSFGTQPLIEGLSAAAGPEWNQTQVAHDFAPFVGGFKMLADRFSNHPDPNLREAFERGRKEGLKKQEGAREQHPWVYGLGQLTGALMTPLPGLGGGANVAARVGKAALGGGIGGALYGGGEAASEEQAPSDIAKAGLGGAVTGGLFGGAGGGVVEGLAKGGKIATSIARGFANPEAEAARKAAEQIGADIKAHGQTLTPEETAAASAAGTPRAIMDIGGTGTRRQAQAVANASPEAGQAIGDFVHTRFAQQGNRIASAIRGMSGRAIDDDALREAARTANKPLYTRAYAAGDRDIWSPELERLSSSPTVLNAMRGAQSKWKDWQIIDGYGAANPPVSIERGGILKFQPGGLRTYPNIQYWDYTARILAGKAEAARSAGNTQEAARFGGLEQQLKAELDKQVPEFRNARSTAAAFFGARDASEAGREYVSREMRPEDARRALMKMSAPEQELFRRSFSDELASKILDLRDRQDVINQAFLSSPNARAKIRMTLGSDRADKLEALLRAETILDRSRQMLGNSTTARQQSDLGKFVHGAGGTLGSGAAGAGALGAIEYLKEKEVEPAHIIAAALVGGAVRHGAKMIDERVASELGKLLVSNDTAQLQKGLEIITKRPVLFDALRAATGAGARTATHKLGPAGAAALGSTVFHAAEEEGGHPADLLSDQTQQ